MAIFGGNTALAATIFFTDRGTDTIQRVEDDGSNLQTLVVGVQAPRGIALDLSAGKMYWTDGLRAVPKIQRADLDGSNVEDILTGLMRPSAIVIGPGRNVACVGFEPPLADGPVTVKKNWVLPLKAELVDDDGFVLGEGDLTAPPVGQVIYHSGMMEDPEDVSEYVLSAGQGMDGNVFEYTGSQWQLNLKTKNYTAPGNNTIRMVSGDGAEYRVEPTCEALFVID